MVTTIPSVKLQKYFGSLFAEASNQLDAKRLVFVISTTRKIVSFT